MGKIKERGTSGAAKNYYTRSQAVRKLQINLPDFRRLCIFKGIYPREPTSRKRANKAATPSTTFYYAKDINYLLHEPLLAKFRDHKALGKKISRALGKNDVGGAARLERTLAPRLRLDHIIKQRYPTFHDALRDLDDALTLLVLFALLPATEHVPPPTITRCQRLTREFELYLIRTHSLRRSFLSIKGIYYQATIQGQDVLWLVPYRFVQRAAGDVDYRIMATFVDFYAALLGFVNFRLYTGIGLVYPPRLDARAEEEGAELGAFRLEGKNVDGSADGINGTKETEVANPEAQAEADRLLALPTPDSEEAETPWSSHPTASDDALGNTSPSTANNVQQLAPSATTLDAFQPIDATADALPQPALTASSVAAATLFAPCTVFLARETPRHALELLLRAFGCARVGWERVLGGAGGWCGEGDARITHQVVDRPDVAAAGNARVPGRVYVQPQWVWDCVNAALLLRADLYAPGAMLPPHLSPFVRARRGVYDPTAPLPGAEEGAGEIEGESQGEEGGDEEVDELEETEIEGEALQEDGAMDVQLADSESGDSDAPDAAAEADDDEFAGFDSDDAELTLDPEVQAAQDHQRELEAEALGLAPTTTAAGSSRAKTAAQIRRAKEERQKLEEVERRKGMMPRRKRKMFEKMVYSNAQKDAEAERLRGKRRKIQKAAEGTGGGL